MTTLLVIICVFGRPQITLAVPEKPQPTIMVVKDVRNVPPLQQVWFVR